MVGEFYRTVLSYGLGLCIATWVELWRDLGLKYSDPLTVSKRQQDSGRWLRSPPQAIELLPIESWLEIPSLDFSLSTGQSLDLVHRKIRDKILWLRQSIPRQVDKKSRFPKEEKGVWGSQRGGKDKLFSPYIPQSGSHKNFFFPFKQSWWLQQKNSSWTLLRIMHQQCILPEDSFSFLKTFWWILLS